MAYTIPLQCGARVRVEEHLNGETTQYVLTPHGISAAVLRELARQKRWARKHGITLLAYVHSKIIVETSAPTGDETTTSVLDRVIGLLELYNERKRNQPEKTRKHHRRRRPLQRRRESIIPTVEALTP